MKRFLVAVGLLLLASAFAAGALAAPETDSLYFGDLESFPAITYTPPANSEYGVYVFSGDGRDVRASAEIRENGEVVAQGSGRGALCSAWLVSGTEYEIRLSGTGSAAVEIARQALSRCADDPLPAEENETKTKVIARPGDAHWFGFTAQGDSMLMLTCVPESPELMLGADLFDSAGSRLAAFEELPGGACMLLAQTNKGCAYRVRIHAANLAAGGYALSLAREAAPKLAPAPRFEVDRLVVPLNGAADCAKVLSGDALLWVSDDPSVVRVDQDGTAFGVRAGSARVTAYGLSASASCEIEARYVPLESLEAVSSRISIFEGDEADVQLLRTPANTSDRSLRFRADDPSIIAVSEDGVVTGLAEGETVLRVKSLDSGLECRVTVHVAAAPRRYRALIVAEENYPYSEGSGRRGSRTSAEAIASMLGTMEYESAAFVTSTRFDLSRAELIAEIRSAFAGATEKDVSLFYISCHGSYAGGMSFFELSDGSSLSARDLERELRGIPGTVVVLPDCCASGGVIGAASDGAAFAGGVREIFANSAFASDKYKVICSAGLDQDSFRMAFNSDDGAGVMATAFARALCDGAGWDLVRNARAGMGADADYDGRITVGELQLYLEARVNWYTGLASSLNGTRYRQSVQAFPAGDPMVIFERKS